MHEGDIISADSSPLSADLRHDQAADPRRRGSGLLICLVVAILAAAAGVGTTLAVRHTGPAKSGTARMPADAAAGQAGRDERRDRL